MLPGKKYKPEDLIRIAWRRRWLLAVPLGLSLVGGIVYAYSLPQRWMSSALIQVTPQQIPETYVRPTVTAKIDSRLEAMRQRILSRTKLEPIVVEFDLYAAQRQSGLMEDVISQMRESDIVTRIVKGDAFEVSYISDDPRLAMRVTERLAGLFISESLRDREMQAEGSSQFLEAQLGEARVRLEQTERQLEAFRRTYSGQLPAQVESNLSVVSSTSMQIQNLVEAMHRDKDQRLLVQRQLADLTSPMATIDAPPPPPPASDPTQIASLSAADQLEQARAALRAMELRFKPEHPDILRMKRTIGELEEKAEREALQRPLSASPGMGPAVSPTDRARRARVRELQNELATIDSRLAQREREVNRLQSIVAAYQARAEAAPTRESELTKLMRDYNTLTEQYASLLEKNEEAKMAADMERRQGGEQLRLLDPARLPGRPISPDRPRIIMLGLLGGLALGVGLVGLLEYRDRSLRTDDDVMLALALPVVAIIPQMTTRSERAAIRRRRLMLSAAAVVTVLGVSALVLWRFVHWRAYLPW
jgi:polysaccharide chain length determinant protein (PEP-CTERM system associated)